MSASWNLLESFVVSVTKYRLLKHSSKMNQAYRLEQCERDSLGGERWRVMSDWEEGDDGPALYLSALIEQLIEQRDAARKVVPAPVPVQPPTPSPLMDILMGRK